MHLAENIPASHVRTTDSDGVLQVKSQDSDEKWYKVSFGSEIQQPFCDCLSWKRNHFPCKHFFAIFNYYPAWGWDKLPLHFVNSLLFTLDEAVIGHQKPTNTVISSAASPVFDDNPDSSVPHSNIQAKANSIPPCMYANLPQKKCFPKALGSTCRELLSEIRQLTFLIDDSSELAHLKTELQGIYQHLQKLALSDGGLQVERAETKVKKRKLPNPEQPPKKMAKIPKTQSKISKFSGRHGSQAAMMRKTFQVHVDVPKLNHAPLANTQRAASSITVLATSDKVTASSNTTPATATQTPVAPLTLQASVAHMPPPTTVLTDAKQLLPAAHSVEGLTKATHITVAPITVPATATHKPIEPITQQPNAFQVPVSTLSTKQAPASATAVPTANTQIPAALATGHITSVKVPAAPPTTVSTAATNLPTVQPTAAPTIEGPTSEQAASCISVQVGKIPDNVSGDPIAHDKISSSSHGKPPILTITDDDDSQDSVTWLTIDNSTPCDPDTKLTLYKESRDGILKTTYWLHDSEIHAGQILLRKEFPHVDGLQDPAFRGELVLPAAYEFVQIINVGRHWVCISTIGCQAGTIKVFDSLYRKPNSLLLDHACHMIVCPQDTVTFLNEKVQRQLGSSDCGLFTLAFATDLCHGLDPSTQSYNQKEMRQHYVHCLESGRMTPFPKTNKRDQ